jgi:hypothetical protein
VLVISARVLVDSARATSADDDRLAWQVVRRRWSSKRSVEQTQARLPRPNPWTIGKLRFCPDCDV